MGTDSTDRSLEVVGAMDGMPAVVMGRIGQVGPDTYNARRVALAAGLPEKTPAYIVNRLCGSGLQAVWSAAQQIRWGGMDFALAGGDESMPRMPFYYFSARSGYKLGDRTLVDGTVAILTDPFGGVYMGRTAEAVARTYDVSRQQQDEFAVESQRRLRGCGRRSSERVGDRGQRVRDQRRRRSAGAGHPVRCAEEGPDRAGDARGRRGGGNGSGLDGVRPGVGAAESVRAGRHHPR